MEPDAIVIPVGGGGLLAGMVTVIQHLKPNIKIIVSLFEYTKTKTSQAFSFWRDASGHPQTGF